MAPCGEEQGVFAGATARIENRADDLVGGGLERRLGLADVPGRAAGVRATKVFAVVDQDVVREKISLCRDFDLPDGHPYTPKVLPSLSKLISWHTWETVSLIRTDWDPWPSYLPARFAEHVGSGRTRAESIAHGY